MPIFGSNWPTQKAGRPLLLKAITRPAAALARQQRSSVGPGLAAINVAGTDLHYATAREPFLIRITAVGTSNQAGSYAWQEITPDPDHRGMYLDVAGSSGALGVDAFYEANGYSNLAVGDRVEVRRDYRSQEVRAQYSHC